MDAPSKAPPTKMLAPTMKPIAMGAIIPMFPFFGSTAVAYTVYTNPKVITISNTTAFHTVTSDDRENADVVYIHIKKIKLTTNTNIYIYIYIYMCVCVCVYIESLMIEEMNKTNSIKLLKKKKKSP